MVSDDVTLKVMSTVRVSVRIPAGLRKEVEEEGRTVSEVVRDALAQHLQASRKAESCYELALRLGIVGVVRRAPRDLSTHRRHFEGFGK
jgi:hypothetical protein